MKVFLGLVLLLISIIVGLFLSYRYTLRKNYYKDFLSFNRLLLDEVMFGKKTIKSIINENNNGNTFYRALNVLNLKKDVELNRRVYSSEDQILIKEYAGIVGKSDSKSQEIYLRKMTDKLSLLCEESVKDEKKYRELYFKMGLFIGLILFIVVI